MKTIPLTRGYEAIVDDEDYESLAGYRWVAQVAKGVVYGTRDEGWVKMHREIMDAPGGIEVDHIDGNGLNNRRDNLRLATCSQNAANRGLGVSNTTGFKGISLAKPRRPGGSTSWRAAIKVGGRNYKLGSYPTKELAAAAYDAAAVRFFGEYAKTNAMLGLIA